MTERARPAATGPSVAAAWADCLPAAARVGFRAAATDRPGSPRTARNLPAMKVSNSALAPSQPDEGVRERIEEFAVRAVAPRGLGVARSRAAISA